MLSCMRPFYLSSVVSAPGTKANFVVMWFGVNKRRLCKVSRWPCAKYRQRQKLQWFNDWHYLPFLFVYVLALLLFCRIQTSVGIFKCCLKYWQHGLPTVCDCIFCDVIIISPVWSPLEMSYVQNSRSGRKYVLFLDSYINHAFRY